LHNDIHEPHTLLSSADTSKLVSQYNYILENNSCTSKLAPNRVEITRTWSG